MTWYKFLNFHFFGDLPRNDALDGHRCSFIKKSLFFKKIIETTANIVVVHLEMYQNKYISSNTLLVIDVSS